MSEQLPTNEGLIFELTEKAMRAEIVASSLALNSDSWPTNLSGHLTKLAPINDRFKAWPMDFVISRRTANTVQMYYGANYWRLNSGMLEIETNPSLPEIESVAVASLFDVILLTRVQEDEPTGNRAQPLAPSRENIRDEQVALHQELGGDPDELLYLPHITWNSVIRSMIDGTVRVGQLPE